MTEVYTVNRLWINGKPTRRVVLNQSNRGPDDAVKYGKLIQKKQVHEGTWMFAGIINSPRANASKVTEIGGALDSDVLRRTGIDVRKMGMR